ncbi:MAG TPA: hypothetical protein VGX94_06455 [Terriglobia bacterium]|nr:hypothetical protein [Terriglobia bacterium]
MADEQPLLGLYFVFTEAQRKLQEQMGTADSLDVKMGVLVGFLGALLAGILVALLAAEPGKVHALLNPPGWFGWIIVGLLALDGVLILVALITSFGAYRPRKFKSGIPFSTLYEWTNEAPKDTKYAFLPTLAEGIKLNEALLRPKQRSAQKAAWFTLGALLALLLTAVAIVIRLKLYS